MKAFDVEVTQIRRDNLATSLSVYRGEAVDQRRMCLAAEVHANGTISEPDGTGRWCDM